jgi:type VI secretion system protein ImpA
MDIDPILAPIPGDNPSGENLRYTSVYDKIQEARRADDLLDQGDWQHEVKIADWNAVFTLAEDALTTRTKDLQIAAWLLESLTITEGFEGVSQGLDVIIHLLDQFWDTLYPEIEEDDLDYRIGPLEFINDKLWLPIKGIPVTDPAKTQGFAWVNWQESRNVGYEKDTFNQYGDVIDDKKRTRAEQIAEGKLSAEEFDAAVASSSRAYYETLFKNISRCVELFVALDNMVDEKFGKEAPRLAELKSSLEDCFNVLNTIVKEKRLAEPDSEEKTMEGAAHQEEAPGLEENTYIPPPRDQASPTLPSAVAGPFGTYQVNRILGSAGIEETLWQEALKKLEKEGIRPALELLLGGSCSAQSVREKTNFGLLMARLCLKAQRPDLARPIVEELNTLIEELQLNRWESPIWLAEALGTLYQCLTADGSSEDDQDRAQEILTRLCTLDVTKAMEYSNRTT